MKKKIKQEEQVLNVFDIHTMQVAQQEGLLFIGVEGLVNNELEEDVLITFTFKQIKEMYYYLQSEKYKNKLNQIRL